MVKEYEFTVKLRGIGSTAEEAWEDVCQNIRFRHPDDYAMPSQYQEIDEWDED